MTKPIALAPIPENIPDELKDNAAWVMWAWEYRNGKQNKPGKWTKPPYEAAVRNCGDKKCCGEQEGKVHHAAVDDATTWCDFPAALAALRGGHGFDGFGPVLQESDGYAGIDIDHCVDPDGTIAPWALAIIRALDSYTEISPSGTGIRIIVRGALPPGRRRTGQIEMYDSGRYLTLTGHHVEATPTTVEERSEALAMLHRQVFGSPKPAKEAAPRPALAEDELTVTAPTPGALTDDEVLRKARAADNGDLFVALFDRGDLSAPRQGDGSQSSADLSLCNLLRFWTGADSRQMDRLFRQSALLRDKWDEKRGETTYGEWTIAKALAGDTYSPNGTAPTTVASGRGPAESDTRDEVIAVQAARIAELEAIVATQHQVIAGAVAILEADMTTEAKVIQMGLAFRQHHGFGTRQPVVDEETGEINELQTFYVHQPSEAERLHVSVDAIQTVMGAVTSEGAAFTKTSDFCKTNPWTGEALDQPHRYTAYRPVHEQLGDTLQAVAANVPEALRRKKRCVRPRPEPKTYPSPPPAPVCDEHPGADLHREGEHAIVARCTSCGLATQAVLTRDGAVLRPITASSGRGNPSASSVAIGLSTAGSSGHGMDGTSPVTARDWVRVVNGGGA